MRNSACVSYRLWPATFVFRARNTILRPDLHRHPDDFVALLAQQISRDAGVHSPAHSEQYAFFLSIHRSEEFRSIAGRVNERTGTLTNLLPRRVNRQG